MPWPHLSRQGSALEKLILGSSLGSLSVLVKVASYLHKRSCRSKQEAPGSLTPFFRIPNPAQRQTQHSHGFGNIFKPLNALL